MKRPGVRKGILIAGVLVVVAVILAGAAGLFSDSSSRPSGTTGAPRSLSASFGAPSETDRLPGTKIARGTVGRWGMSDAVGPLAVGEGREDGMLLPGASVASPATQQLLDEEAKRIVETAEQEVVDLLERERHRLDALVGALLERETLDQPDAYRVAGIEAPAPGAEREAEALT